MQHVPELASCYIEATNELIPDAVTWQRTCCRCCHVTYECRPPQQRPSPAWRKTHSRLWCSDSRSGCSSSEQAYSGVSIKSWQTRNTLDCDQANVHSSRVVFSARLFVKICLFVLSLYTIGRLVTLPYEKFQISIIHYRLETDGKVWSVCINTVNRIMPFEVFQDARRSPSTIEQNMKGIGWRVAELWPFEFLQNVWMGPEVGQSVGRSSIFILLTLISYFLSLR